MRNKLSLNDVEWKEFRIEKVFDVSGTTTTHPTELKIGGRTPRITCAATNNGLDDVYSNLPTEKGGVLTVDSATDGYISYQEKDFIATDHVEKIMLKDNKRMNKHIGLFLKSAITKSISSKYGYGYKFSQKRIRPQIIMLPVDKNGNPNWRFMEDYIKQEQKEIASKVVSYYKNKLDEILEEYIQENGKYGGALQWVDYKNVYWKVFEFNDVFREIQRGKRLTKANQIPGNTPYVSSSAINNGVDNFISNNQKVRKSSNSLSIANSGSVGSTFYHKYEYVASDHITSLRLDNADENIYLFMATIVKRLEEKYSFNREINDTRIQREKLILPVDENGNPNFKYMRDFIINMQKENIEKTIEYIYIYIYIISTIVGFYKNKYAFKNIQWREFFIGSDDGVFDIQSTNSGIDKNKLNTEMGNIPYITRSDVNHGINLFVSKNQNKKYKIDEGNVITIGLDTQTVFYQKNSFFTGQNIQVLRNDNLNKEIALFIIPLLKIQMEKFNWGGNGATLQRLNRTKLMLPIDENEKINYEFMENYIKFREFEKYIQIIEYLSYVV